MHRSIRCRSSLRLINCSDALPYVTKRCSSQKHVEEEHPPSIQSLNNNLVFRKYYDIRKDRPEEVAGLSTGTSRGVSAYTAHNSRGSRVVTKRPSLPYHGARSEVNEQKSEADESAANYELSQPKSKVSRGIAGGIHVEEEHARRKQKGFIRTVKGSHQGLKPHAPSDQTNKRTNLRRTEPRRDAGSSLSSSSSSSSSSSPQPRQERSASAKRSAEVSKNEAHSTSKPKELFEEFFAESGDESRSQGRNVPKEMPRLKLEHLVTGEPCKPPVRESYEESVRRTFEAKRENLGKEKCILILRGLSTSLDEADFRRLSPKGSHIDEWEHELGRIMQVIPGRNCNTLERNGIYYLLFASPESAQVYKAEVERRKALCVMYRPRNTAAPVPPPPGYLINGEDMHDLVENFTIIPANIKLLIAPVNEPFDIHLQSLVDYGGYKTFNLYQHNHQQQQQQQQSPSSSPSSSSSSPPSPPSPSSSQEPPPRNDIRAKPPRTKVLVHVDGPALSTNTLMDAISLQGYSRGWQWDTAARMPVRRLQHTGWRGMGPGEFETPASAAELVKRRNRWTVEFRSEAEAARFARSWHCSRLPGKARTHTYMSEPPLVTAEVVW